ncbi:hypothetical protein BDV93DRAFT_541705 [Ceratobasidium sp. AG-I]|nr:hypothetical protein BDV93DRAFT_541705 [Ceratobasidium sp. AG-I]
MDRLANPIVAFDRRGEIIEDYESEKVIALTISAIARDWCPISRRTRNRWILSAVTRTQFMGRSIAMELHFDESISPCAMIDVYPNLCMFPENTVNHVWIGVTSLRTIEQLVQWMASRGKGNYRLNERGEGMRRWHLDLVKALEEEGYLEEGSLNEVEEVMSYSWEAVSRYKSPALRKTPLFASPHT